MRFEALIMAGGRGSRLGMAKEKPLVLVGGASMLERVARAVSETDGISRIAVAVSRHTPRTGRAAAKLGLDVITTPARGYVADMMHAVRALGAGHTLVVAADLPLITSAIVQRVLDSYRLIGKPSLTVAVRSDALEALGIRVSYELLFRGLRLTPVGMNVVDGSKMGEGLMDEEVLQLEEAERLINVNTSYELRLAKMLLRRLGGAGGGA